MCVGVDRKPVCLLLDSLQVVVAKICLESAGIVDILLCTSGLQSIILNSNVMPDLTSVASSV